MIEEIARENLLLLARKYARATKLPLRSVSTQFYGNTIFFEKFARHQKTISLAMYDQVFERFRKQWPDGEPWPELQSINFPADK